MVAPVTTIDSPSARITNSWKRSAKWPVSSSHADIATRLIPGTQNVHSGPP